MRAVLSLADVSIRYGPRTAVRGLSLSVRAGEVYGLLGPNGCGKSSTLGAIAGYLPTASGDIRVAGRREADDPLAYRRLIGLGTTLRILGPVVNVFIQLVGI